MINHAAVRIAFRNRFDPIAVPAGTVKAWENRATDPAVPQSGKLSIEEHLVPVSERKVATQQIQLLGIMQYTFRVPLGKGTEAIEAAVKLVGDQFEAGVFWTHGGVTIAVDRCERGAGEEDSPWYRVPLRITFRTYVSTTF